MIKKIKELSKVFIKEYFENLDIFNKDTKKFNKKSMYTWMLLITIIAITFLSYKAIDWLKERGQGVLFLEIYFPLMATIFLFQTSIICSNVFYFSKDLEYILPLPIRPKELLIAKFLNVLCIIYASELMFLTMPLLIYGLIVARNLMYFFTMVLVLILFPILFVIAVSIIMLFIMQLTKFIKNKDIFQIIIVILMSTILSCAIISIAKPIFNNILETKISAEILKNKLNNYFIIINPCISLLTNFKILNIILELIKIIIINIIAFIIFIILGKILYLKNLLKNIAYINKKKNNKRIIKNKYKKKSIRNSYIKNEFKKIIKNPTFFTECIFQYIFIIVIVLLLINLFVPIILTSFEEQDIINELGIDDFALQAVSMVLGFIQIIFTLNNLSITAISREGKNSVVMKYIPVPLYKQFLWKSIPNIFFNTIAIVSTLIVIYKHVPYISIWYYASGFLIAMLLNIINSFIMLTVDLRKPNLDWTTESASVKDNGNKLYQYVTTIVIVMLITYFTEIFEGINIMISLISISSIFLIILIALNIYIKRNINKLFEKIF